MRKSLLNGHWRNNKKSIKSIRTLEEKIRRKLCRNAGLFLSFIGSCRPGTFKIKMIALVPTCNRPELFARLVSRLEGFQVIGFVNNSTPENEKQYLELNLPEETTLVFTGIKGEPKACHVMMFKIMLQFVQDECLVIEDDVNPCRDFYKELTDRVRTLKSVDKGSRNKFGMTNEEFTLSPIYLPGRNSDFYTGGKSEPVTIGDYEFIDQAWIDGNFYMTAGILSAMKQWLSGKIKSYPASSGIGRRNSFEIYRRKWKMYTVVPTLVEHLDQDSVMFGDRRKQIPLIASF